MKTVYTRPEDVEHKWYVVDATDKVLGRLAVEVADLLRGKRKPTFQPNVDTGDYVIIINADKVKLTGMKEETKTYWTASRYVGHSKSTSLKNLKEKRPGRIVEKAVWGMIPKNRLGRAVYKKLFVYAGPEHRHQAQQPEIYEVA